MKCNVNPIDGSIRAALGLFLLATPILDFHTYPYNYLGLVLMLTAVVGYCPLYSAFGSASSSGPRTYKRSGSHG